MIFGIFLYLITISQTIQLEKIDNYISSLGPVFTGVSVINCRTGREIYSHNSNHLFVPASVEKLLTIAGGFILLGPDYRFKTELYSDSFIDNRAYNVYIKGGADPSFDINGIKIFVSALQENNIQEIIGDIIIDETCIDTTPLGKGWMWDEGYFAYSARISGATCNGNVVSVEADIIQNTVELQYFPESDFVELINNLQYSPNQDYEIVRIFDGEKNIIIFSGTINRSFKKSINVEQPALMTGYLLKNELLENALYFSGNVKKGQVNSSCLHINDVYSQNFSNIADSVLIYSINLASELIIRKIARLKISEGSDSDGLEIIKEALNAIGVDTRNIKVVDGSGLSRYNLMSPNFLSNLLKAMLNNSSFSEYFYRSLPLMGFEGTVSFRLRNISERRVRAKTGSLSGISTLAGYVETKQGDTLAYAIMMNNFLIPYSRIRNVQDSIIYTLLNLEGLR